MYRMDECCGLSREHFTQKVEVEVGITTVDDRLWTSIAKVFFFFF